MDKDDRDLDKLSDLLGEVLGRIDKNAGELVRSDADDPAQMAEQLESDTERLHGLVDELVQAALDVDELERSNANIVVEKCLRDFLQVIDYPLVVRQTLSARTDLVACAPSQLTRGIQRALSLAASHAGHGGELSVRTTTKRQSVIVQLHSSGHGTQHLTDRTQTLRAFIEELRGELHAKVDSHGALDLEMKLPLAVEVDR